MAQEELNKLRSIITELESVAQNREFDGTEVSSLAIALSGLAIAERLEAINKNLELIANRMRASGPRGQAVFREPS